MVVLGFSCILRIHLWHVYRQKDVIHWLHGTSERGTVNPQAPGSSPGRGAKELDKFS